MKKLILIIPFIMTLMMTNSASAEGETEVLFDSKESLIKKFHESGFDRVLEIKRGVLKITVHSSEADSVSATHETNVTYEEAVPELDYVFEKAIVRKLYARAYKAHDSMICYRIEQVYSQRDQSCFIFPYPIEDVIEAVTK